MLIQKRSLSFINFFLDSISKWAHSVKEKDFKVASKLKFQKLVFADQFWGLWLSAAATHAYNKQAENKISEKDKVNFCFAIFNRLYNQLAPNDTLPSSLITRLALTLQLDFERKEYCFLLNYNQMPSEIFFEANNLKNTTEISLQDYTENFLNKIKGNYEISFNDMLSLLEIDLWSFYKVIKEASNTDGRIIPWLKQQYYILALLIEADKLESNRQLSNITNTVDKNNKDLSSIVVQKSSNSLFFNQSQKNKKNVSVAKTPSAPLIVDEEKVANKETIKVEQVVSIQPIIDELNQIFVDDQDNNTEFFLKLSQSAIDILNNELPANVTKDEILALTCRLLESLYNSTKTWLLDNQNNNKEMLQRSLYFIAYLLTVPQDKRENERNHLFKLFLTKTIREDDIHLLFFGKQPMFNKQELIIQSTVLINSIKNNFDESIINLLDECTPVQWKGSYEYAYSILSLAILRAKTDIKIRDYLSRQKNVLLQSKKIEDNIIENISHKEIIYEKNIIDNNLIMVNDTQSDTLIIENIKIAKYSFLKESDYLRFIFNTINSVYSNNIISEFFSRQILEILSTLLDSHYTKPEEMRTMFVNNFIIHALRILNQLKSSKENTSYFIFDVKYHHTKKLWLAIFSKYYSGVNTSKLRAHTRWERAAPDSYEELLVENILELSSKININLFNDFAKIESLLNRLTFSDDESTSFEQIIKVVDKYLSEEVSRQCEEVFLIYKNILGDLEFDDEILESIIEENNIHIDLIKVKSYINNIKNTQISDEIFSSNIPGKLEQVLYGNLDEIKLEHGNGQINSNTSEYSFFESSKKKIISSIKQTLSLNVEQDFAPLELFELIKALIFSIEIDEDSQVNDKQVKYDIKILNQLNSLILKMDSEIRSQSDTVDLLNHLKLSDAGINQFLNANNFSADVEKFWLTLFNKPYLNQSDNAMKSLSLA